MILPRFIRAKDAPAYLGFDRHTFTEKVRPFVTVITEEGVKGVRFDRLDLDEWADHYKSRNGRAGKNIGENTCQNDNSQGLGSKMEYGKLKNGSTDIKTDGLESQPASNLLKELRQKTTLSSV